MGFLPDLEAAGAAASSLKAAFDLSKTIVDVHGTVKVQAQVVELQSKILAAQQYAMTARETETALVRRVQELETEVARLKKWDADKDQYKLQNAGSGSFVYSPKAEPTETEPNHWLCVKCFESGQRSVLQNQGRPKGNEHTTAYMCPTCKTGFTTHYNNGPHRRGTLMSDGTTHA